MTVRIGIVGDYDLTNLNHLATAPAIAHSGRGLHRTVLTEWASTESLAATDPDRRLESFAGLLIATGSPYRSMEGALNAIRWAREGSILCSGHAADFSTLLSSTRGTYSASPTQHTPNTILMRRICLSHLWRARSLASNSRSTSALARERSTLTDAETSLSSTTAPSA